jgi:hypothetical protein
LQIIFVTFRDQGTELVVLFHEPFLSWEVVHKPLSHHHQNPPSLPRAIADLRVEKVESLCEGSEMFRQQITDL